MEELVKFQGLDHGTWPARPEYARPVPGDATAPDRAAATGRGGAFTASSAVLLYLLAELGDVTG